MHGKCIQPLRHGLTRIEVVVSTLMVFLLAAVGVPAMQGPFDTARSNTCKSNLRNLAVAISSYGNDFNYYPGYMNFLATDSGKSYCDPETNEITPVSWVIDLLPRLDRKAIYDGMTRDISPDRPKFDAKIYVELFTCPSVEDQAQSGPRLSYVANTGMPDLPAAVTGQAGPLGASAGFSRDHQSNGMFFDNFSEHPLVKKDGFPNLMITMRPSMVEDPKNMTILFSENLDAKNYLIAPDKIAENVWHAAEAQVGCVWKPGIIDGSVKPPTMFPPKGSLAINVRGGWGNGRDWEYARPSSNHSGGVNVAFVATNIDFLRDDISYFVFAKLMASCDAKIKEPGTVTPGDLLLRDYPLTEADFGRR